MLRQVGGARCPTGRGSSGSGRRKEPGEHMTPWFLGLALAPLTAYAAAAAAETAVGEPLPALRGEFLTGR
jgi:hypothetical protein